MAKHGDMCRFNPNVKIDEDNYELVEGNMLELCQDAIKQGERSYSIGERMPDVPPIPRTPTQSSAVSSTSQLPLQESQLAPLDKQDVQEDKEEECDLRRRYRQLGGPRS